MPKFENKKLICEECGTEFTWDAAEQAFFEKKGFKKVPKRCRACRSQKREEIKKEKENEREITCAMCGKKSATKNEVAPDEEALCFDCYLKERAKNQ